MGTILDTDGTFANGVGLFSGSVTVPGSAAFTFDGEVSAVIDEVTEMDWHVQLHHAVSVEMGEQYSICFSGKAEAARDITVNIDQGGTPGYDSVLTEGVYTPSLGTDYQDYKYTFTSSTTDTSARLTFNLGLLDVDVQLDNIGIYPGAECGDPSKIPAAPVGSGSKNIVGTPPITTEGNKVLFGGQEGSVAGVSLFWSNFTEGGKYYTEGVVETLKNDWNAKLIRAAMGVEEANGYLMDPATNLTRVRTVVDAALANDMYVIIDWHTHHADEHQQAAIDFFTDMATMYGENDNVIYEIFNEPKCASTIASAECSWDNKTSWAEIKDYSEEVIAAIRAIDSDNLIIVGTPFYSQFVDDASEDPIDDVNVAYTLHFYAASHQGTEMGRAINALKNGIPLFVTEWGTVGASGDGAMDVEWSDTWMEFLYNNNISHANWSITDKAEGSAALKPGASTQGGWTDADLTESGLYVKEVIKDW